MMMSGRMAFSVAAVSSSVSPFFTDEEDTDMFMTSAPSRLPAISKEDWVRVEGSKNRLIWVRPRKVAAFLHEHPKVSVVHYPGLPGNPFHALAARQMSDFGGMLSIQLRGGESAAIALTNRLTLFTRATSLGGPESLIEHRASVEGPTTISPRNLLRVSVGLENAEDLIEDLERALG